MLLNCFLPSVHSLLQHVLQAALTMNVLQVAPETLPLCKAHSTVVTLMRLIPCVQIEVVLQRGLLGKCLVAQRASKRLDTGVDAYVVGQATLLGEALPTDQTQVLPVLLQVAHIALQMLEDSVTPPAQVWPLDQYAV